ncbi:hypothetical protein D1872_218720 [compost metagenome]
MRVEKRTEKKFEDLTTNEKDIIKLSLASGKLDEFIAGDLEKKIIKKINLPKTEKKENSGSGGNSTGTPDSGGTSGGNKDAGNAGGAGTGNNAGTEGK